MNKGKLTNDPRNIHILHFKDHNNHPRRNPYPRNAPQQIHLPQQPPHRPAGQIPLIPHIPERRPLVPIHRHHVLDSRIQRRPHDLTGRHTGEAERILGAQRHEDGREQQLDADLEHEERKRQGGQARVGWLVNGADDDEKRDVHEPEDEVPVGVVHFPAAAGAERGCGGGSVCEGEGAEDEGGEADEAEDGGGDADYWFW